MAKKVYAIKKGFDFDKNIHIENKIVNTWNECLKYVKGVKGAQYKSFASMEEANEYINAGKPFLKKGEDEYPMDQLHAYVDGSYNQRTGKFSYAVVMVKDDVIVHIENGAAENNEQQSIRQIAGELLGAIKSVEYAAQNNLKEIVILHDYVGVCYHATGFWERKEESSKKYHKQINELMKENGIKVTFVKVDSHTGDLFNEVVDEFAKKAIGVSVKGETLKYLKNKTVMVANKELKSRMLDITSEATADNIIVMEKLKKKSKEEIDNKEEVDDVLKYLRVLMKENEKDAKEYIGKLNDKIKNELIYRMMIRHIQTNN